MPALKTHPGETFGRLTVLERVANTSYGRTQFNCTCGCGREKVVAAVSLRSGNTRSCGCLAKEVTSRMARGRHGPDSPTWKGGRYVDSNGCVHLYRPEMPGGCKQKYVAEHLVVMSRSLGRPLLPEETVHHKNGIKSDNRICNLELWASNHTPGQRVSDLIEYAISILATYKPEAVAEAPHERKKLQDLVGHNSP